MALSNALESVVDEMVVRGRSMGLNVLMELQSRGMTRFHINSLISHLDSFINKSGTIDTLLKQQHALFVKSQLEFLEKSDGDLTQMLTGMVDINKSEDVQFPLEEYLAFMNDRCVEKSSQFELSHARLSYGIPERPLTVRRILPQSVFRCRSGVRFSLSSANASDNYTFSKCESVGGHVLSALIEIGDSDAVVEVQVEFDIDLPSGNIIHLVSDDRIEPVGCKELFILPKEAHLLSSYMTDGGDHFRLVKHALIRTGIVWLAEGEIQLARGTQSIRVSVWNRGPSGSGFASSSAVSLNLMAVLTMAGGNSLSAHDLSIRTWIFENELGLKSGRQDIDSIVFAPGLNSLVYEPGRLFPSVRPIPLGDDLFRHICLIDSGIPRTRSLDVRRGLNIRHLLYMTGDLSAYPAMLQSVQVHSDILNSFTDRNYQQLGILMTKYMELRTIIDPSATSSVYDDGERRYLQWIFDHLQSQGLTYGGMLAGAMGGGVMIVVRTPQTSINKLQSTLAGLSKECVNMRGELPYANLRILDFRIATRGIECHHISDSSSRTTDLKSGKKPLYQ